MEDGQPFVPSAKELTRWLDEHGVTAIVIGDLARSKFENVVRDAGFDPVYEGGGVSVWRSSSVSPATGGG